MNHIQVSFVYLRRSLKFNRMFILLTLLAHALAEPPVGDGYAARSNHDHGFGNQRSLSEEYGVPSVGGRSNFANDVRSILSYDQAGSIPSQEYGSPGFRSASQKYEPPNARTSVSQGYGHSNPRSSLSQEYTLPNARSGASQIYEAPKARSGLSQDYGVPNTRSGISQGYGSSNVRSELSQEYGAPNARSGLSQQYRISNTRSNSQEYTLPTSRSLSQQYGPPSQRNPASDYTQSQDYTIPNARLSQKYGTPQLRKSQDYNTGLDSYGTPLQRSSQGLSEDYGLPSQRNFDQSPSEKYGQPNHRSSQSHSPSFKSFGSGRFNKGSPRSFQPSFGSSPSQSYGSPPSTSYSVSSARNIDSYSTAAKSISAKYLPSSRSVSESYEAPEERSLSTDYGTPDTRGLNTDAYASSVDARSIPSTTYGAPSTRDAMPSEQYGVPEQYDALSSQGYSYARNALDELLNQEPANYDFGYKVSDYISGSDFGHTESRQENKAEGSYFVVLPDGTKQTVEYEADERGFKPRISVEPAESSAGYDDNAANLDRSSDGPY